MLNEWSPYVSADA